MPRPALLEAYRALVSLYKGMAFDENIAINFGAMAILVSDFGLVELREPLLALYDQELVDSISISRKELETFRAEVVSPDWKQPMVDVAEEVSWWGCFSETAMQDGGKDDPDLADEEQDELMPPVEPYSYSPPVPYRAPPKVGRNDPCSCGRGKKFKKSCGA
jgi:hypothetical protein